MIGLFLTVAGLDCNEPDDRPLSTATGACLNDADLGMVCAPSFADDFVTDCGRGAAGDAAGTSACLQRDPPGLSQECADCYGAQTACVATNCLSAGCASDRGGESCLACIEEAGCQAAFDSCRGDFVAGCEDWM
jgi:hypothetical protein